MNVVDTAREVAIKDGDKKLRAEFLEGRIHVTDKMEIKVMETQLLETCRREEKTDERRED